MMRSTAPYDLMVGVLTDTTPREGVVARAFGASPAVWQRALALEACGVQFGRALRASGLGARAPLPLQHQLSDATARAVRQALTLPAQMTELAGAARELGIRILVLKGAARLLDGGIPATRSMSDIDVLTSPNDAGRLHALLTRRMGYESMAASPEHHLPTLMRPGALAIEVHIQLGPRLTELDARIWRDARAANGYDLLVPSATATMLHALEHAALVHWAVRYRLRDLLDVAEAWNDDVDHEEVDRHIRRSTQRVPLATLLEGAGRFTSRIPTGRASAWRTIRRVAQVRHLFAAHVSNAAHAKSLCIAGGVLAEVSPRALLRPAQLALFGVRQAGIAPTELRLGQPGTV